MVTAVDKILVCKRKRRFVDEEDAWQATLSTGLYHYRCPFCKGYHLTKTLKGKDKFKKILQKEILEQRAEEKEEARKARQAPKQEMRRIRKMYLNGDISLEEYQKIGRTYDENHPRKKNRKKKR